MKKTQTGVICGSVICFLAVPAGAVEFLPTVQVSEIYTTNVALAPPGQEEDAWLTRIAPGFRLLGKGQSFNYELDYTLEGLLDASNSGRNEVFHQLGGVGVVDLIGQSLQLKGAGNILQVNIAPDKATSNSNIFDTGNRANAIIWNAGPVWQRKFGESEVTGYANYGKVYYDKSQTQDITTLQGHFSFHSDPAGGRPITYELAYDINHLQYETSGTAETQSAYLRLGYRITSDVEVFALGGADNDFADLKSSTPNQPRWEVGAATVLGGGRVEAAIGHRFFGTTYRFNWATELPDSRYSISYNEEPSTTDITTLLQLNKVAPGVQPDPGSLVLDPGLGTPGAFNRFILKNAVASGQWSTFLATLRVGLFWQRQLRTEFLPLTPDPGAYGDQRSYGIQTGADWQLGQRSVVSLGGGWQRRAYDIFQPAPAKERDSYFNVRGGLTYRLGQKTDLAMGLEWDTARGSPDYEQFLARLDVTRRF